MCGLGSRLVAARSSTGARLSRRGAPEGGPQCAPDVEHLAREAVRRRLSSLAPKLVQARRLESERLDLDLVPCLVELAVKEPGDAGLVDEGGEQAILLAQAADHGAALPSATLVLSPRRPDASAAVLGVGGDSRALLRGDFDQRVQVLDRAPLRLFTR